jgi:hypothetical protein
MKGDKEPVYFLTPWRQAIQCENSVKIRQKKANIDGSGVNIVTQFDNFLS